LKEKKSMASHVIHELPLWAVEILKKNEIPRSAEEMAKIEELLTGRQTLLPFTVNALQVLFFVRFYNIIGFSS
jgi:hypothetical protein